MAEETSTAGGTTPRRRRTRRTTTSTATSRGTSTGRRRRLAGPELVDNLNQMVDQLIKENRKLKRQVERLSQRGTAANSGTVERGLRSIQRRVQKAIADGGTTRRRATRRRTTATGTRGRRAATGRRRTTASGTGSASGS